MVFPPQPIGGKEAPPMGPSHRGRLRQPVRLVRRPGLQGGDLPLTYVLTEDRFERALQAIEGVGMDRSYAPLVTPGVSPGQVLSADPSCRAAVARLLAHRVARGPRPCSAGTGADCRARRRRPEQCFADVARDTGRTLGAHVDPRWLWKGRRVHV